MKIKSPLYCGEDMSCIYKDKIFGIDILAKSNLMIDNSKTRVTMWSFEVDDETGQHIHEYDYVIVPMLDGALKIVDKDDCFNSSQKR